MFRKHKFIKNAPVVSEPYPLSQEYNPRLFDDHSVVVNVNVSVVEEPDDGVAKCMSGLFSCCLGIGKKAAST